MFLCVMLSTLITLFASLFDMLDVGHVHEHMLCACLCDAETFPEKLEEHVRAIAISHPAHPLSRAIP